MTDLERVELAVRRAATRTGHGQPAPVALHNLADELLRVSMEKDPVEETTQ